MKEQEMTSKEEEEPETEFREDFGEDFAIKQHFCRLVYPVSIGRTTDRSRHLRFEPGDFEAHRRSLNAHLDWRPYEPRLTKYLLPHVGQFLYGERVGSADPYVSVWMLTESTRQRLFSNRKAYFVDRSSREPHRYPIQFAHVDLYLFRSGVGFLIIEFQVRGPVEIDPTNEEEPSRQSLRLSELCRLVNRISAWHFGAEHASVALPQGEYPTRELVKSVLDQAMPDDFEWSSLSPSRALVFSYVFLSPSSTDMEPAVTLLGLAKPFFWLRRGYDQMYSPSAEDLKWEDNPEIVRTYGNVAFGLSRGGWCTMVVDNGAQFLSESFAGQVRHNYFVLFVLGLHYQFAVARLEQFLADLNLQVGTTLSYRTQLRRLKRLQRWILDFTLRCSINVVSNAQTYYRIYHHWKSLLGIDSTTSELRSIVEALNEFLRSNQIEKQNRVANLLTWLFLPVSVVTSVVGLVKIFFPTLTLGHAGLWIGTIGFLTIYTIGVTLALRR